MEYWAFMAIFTLFYIIRIFLDSNYKKNKNSFREIFIVLILGAIAQIIVELWLYVDPGY